MSRLRLLRWQLPLSYAAIALLAVLALGITLLGSLRSLYRAQELDYLSGNAVVIADEIAPLLAADERPVLQTQIDGFSFLTQTRIQVTDATGESVLADSGEPGTRTPAISVARSEAGLLDALGMVQEEIAIVVEEQQSASGAVTSQRVVTRTSRLPAQASLYGFSLGAEAAAGGARSSLAVEVPIRDAQANTLGRVRLSEGPAYGSVILRSVATGWVVAGTVAVVLAAVAGWLASRRLTQPLLGLTAVTERMAAGDLGARADVGRGDELGLLARSFNNMAVRVESMVQSLRQFTADAAHELHTPLTALQTDLQLLEPGGDAAQQARVARAQHQAVRLQALADSLLELSQLEAAAGAVERATLNLTALVQRTGELYASQAEQADLDLALRLPEQTVFVRGVAQQLERALANVLDNSLKFTPAPGTIMLALATESDTAVVTVRDSGIGIPAQDLPQLFSRFHRGRNTAGYPGSGLGLAIVYEIMARHEGRVAIRSGAWGTEVQLTLPCQSPDGNARVQTTVL